MVEYEAVHPTLRESCQTILANCDNEQLSLQKAGAGEGSIDRHLDSRSFTTVVHHKIKQFKGRINSIFCNTFRFSLGSKILIHILSFQTAFCATESVQK